MQIVCILSPACSKGFRSYPSHNPSNILLCKIIFVEMRNFLSANKIQRIVEKFIQITCLEAIVPKNNLSCSNNLASVIASVLQ